MPYACLFLLAFGNVAAQKKVQPEVCYQLSERNGLSDNKATCFFRDSRGVMWIGTDYGLNSFDGSTVKQYHSSNTGLISDVIKDIKEDKLEQLWIATSNSLSSYSLVTHNFSKYELPKTFPGHCNFMESLCVVDDKVYIATGEGLVVYEPAKKTFQRYGIPVINGKHQLGNSMRCILADKNKNLWIASFGGLWRFSIVTKQFDMPHFTGMPEGEEELVVSLFEDHAGKIWAGYWDKGLNMLDPATNTSTRYADAGTNILDIAEQKAINGHSLLWSTFMLTALDRELNTFNSRQQELIPQRNIGRVTKLYCGADNLLWIGTERGVFIYDPSKQYFTHYFMGDKEITTQSISFHTAKEGLYIGGQEQFVLGLYDDTMNRIKDLSGKINALWHTGSHPVLGIRDAGDKLWLATGGGVVMYDKRNGSVKHFHHGNSALPGDFTQGIFTGRDGTVYFLSWRKGLWRFDATSQTFSALDTGYNFSQGVEDVEGNIWLAELSNGLIKI